MIQTDAIRRALLENDPTLLAGTAEGPDGEEPRDSSELVVAVEKFLRRFLVLLEPAYLTLTLWIAGTFLADCFDCFPYLALLSPAKRCGKTRLLEVLETLASTPWRGTAPTPAALFRMMSETPTLLLDEVEALNSKNKSETAQAILAILNAGHRRGSTIPRCSGQRHELVHFPVYGPKAFAAIGRLPDTLTDRSILITMQRRLKTQKIERFLAGRARLDASPIRAGLEGFAQGYRNVVEEAYLRLLNQDLPFLGDRDAELWIPLFAICAAASPARVEELKICSIALSRTKEGSDCDDSLSLSLLSDIRSVWTGSQRACGTATLIASLKALDEAPWLEYDLTPRKMARMLKPFEVGARGVRIGEEVCRGYRLEDLEPAFSRYLEIENATSATNQ